MCSNRESPGEREDQWPDLLVDRRPIQERRGQVESLGERDLNLNQPLWPGGRQGVQCGGEEQPCCCCCTCC